ncbi:hypothetical protein ACGYLO_10500 [Sulfitobacter sp. 1A13353]|uniref:hypothetical protein n=1 Tax=Sulfitobacter sp. 1A13353 TaxID=3368568 RepID=UPI0037462C78
MTDQAGMHFITTLTDLSAANNEAPHRDSRCVGYLKDKDQAVRLIEMNAGDINEAGTFPLCVIETMAEGIYPIASPVDWFAWDEAKQGYARFDGPPEDLQGVCGFSLG